MAMSYEQSADLMKDMTFIGRIKISCLTYAAYIWNEAASTPGHSSRTRWAQMCFSQPDGAANQVTPITVMDPAVQQDGAAITDQALQGAVEGAVNKMI